MKSVIGMIDVGDGGHETGDERREVRVLDLAGGPGAYAVLMCQANPGMRCVTVDLPAMPHWLVSATNGVIAERKSKLWPIEKLNGAGTLMSVEFHFGTWTGWSPADVVADGQGVNVRLVSDGHDFIINGDLPMPGMSVFVR